MKVNVIYKAEYKEKSTASWKGFLTGRYKKDKLLLKSRMSSSTSDQSPTRPWAAGQISSAGTQPAQFSAPKG